MAGIAFNEHHETPVDKRVPELLQDRTMDTCETWYNPDFTLEELEQTLRSLRTSGKSLDNDAIHPKMIKFTVRHLNDCLLYIGNRSLDGR